MIIKSNGITESDNDTAECAQLHCPVNHTYKPVHLKRSNPLLFFVLLAALVGCSGNTEPAQDPLGREESTTTTILEGGASALQSDRPLDPMNIYLVGFHPMKKNPAHLWKRIITASK